MIRWRTEKRKISELKPFPGNPRKANEKEIKDLDKSLEKFNVADPLIINTDNIVIGGNFRLSRLREKGIKEVDVRVPDRKLTRKEAEELNLRLNKNQGSWDEELLANFDEELLKEVGWSEAELEKIFFGLESSIYKKELVVPVYRPYGKEVGIEDLYDDSLVNEYLEEIEKLNCDEEMKKFLRYGAYRHLRFYYGNIAEFYSQLKDKKVRELFEKMALVIIDFNRAIENGYVRLMEDLFDLIKKDEK